MQNIPQDVKEKEDKLIFYFREKGFSILAVAFEVYQNNMGLYNAYLLVENIIEAQKIVHNFDNTYPFKIKVVEGQPQKGIKG